jgi:hypothetical protein
LQGPTCLTQHLLLLPQLLLVLVVAGQGAPLGEQAVAAASAAAGGR